MAVHELGHRAGREPARTRDPGRSLVVDLERESPNFAFPLRAKFTASSDWEPCSRAVTPVWSRNNVLRFRSSLRARRLGSAGLRTRRSGGCRCLRDGICDRCRIL